MISDNDYCGDPDGLVQLAHHHLSPSVELRAIIGSSQLDVEGKSAAEWCESSVAAAGVIAELTGRTDVPIISGTDGGPEAIVAEAMRDDTDLPLFVCCGGGLTAMAAAWQAEPRIADRLTLVWIGGDDEEPIEEGLEYNASIDPAATAVVLDESDLRMWQVPRATYRQAIASRAELAVRMRPQGPLGAHLYEALGQVMDTWQMGETYVLGDSPLVLLTALVSNWHAEPSSCRWIDRGRRRVFTHLDNRLMFEDLYAQLALLADG